METIDRLENLDNIVSESVRKYGESIEGYVDHRDLYLSDETANKILSRGEDYFWEFTSEYYYPDDSDDYYSDHYEFVISSLNLDDDEKEEYHDQIMEAIKEVLHISVSIDEALDLTSVCINVAVTPKEVDYVWGWESLEYKKGTGSKSGKEILTYIPDDYDDILKIFGLRASEYKSWFNNTLRKERDEKFNNFMEKFNQEIMNSGQGFDQLVFGVKMSLREALKLKEAKSITLEPGYMCGFLDTWNGGGSLLDLGYVYPVTIDLNKENVHFYIDGFDGYGIDQIYGMSSDAWECKYTINGLEEK